MSALIHALPVLELRSAAQGLIEGYASTFGGIDSFGDTILPGAFAGTIAKSKPLLLWQHQADRPIGRWTDLAEDGRGLHVRGQLNMQTDAGKQAYAHLREQDINGLSIGFRIPPFGAESRDGVRQIKAADLVEISVVSLPADLSARVTVVKSEQPATLRDFERALQTIGYSRREAAAIAQHGFGAQPDDDTEAIEAALAVLHQTFKG